MSVFDDQTDKLEEEANSLTSAESAPVSMPQTETLYDDDRNITQTYSHINNILNGPYKVYDKNQQLSQEFNFKDGELDGVSRSFEHNRLTMILNYQKGKMHGLFQVFYPTDGQVRMKGAYSEGKRQGVFIYFDEQGNVSRQETYKDDQLHGPCADYTPTGEVFRTSSYTKGVLDAAPKDHPFNVADLIKMAKAS